MGHDQIQRETQRILVVDDAVLIHRLLEARLRDLGCELVFATTGGEALRLARRGGIDLVLLDLGLPDLDGITVCRALKDDVVTHDVPVIIISVASNSQDKVRGFDAGAIDYVVKPFDPAELRARVRTALRTKALLDLLTSQAQIDGLTGLHNRRYFDHRLAEELAAGVRHGAPVGLLLLDIDRFKSFNDEFGHPTGDAIVRRFADLLRAACRVYDAPCRYGGDEFAVILPGADAAATREIGERVLALVHGDADLARLAPTRITSSIGAASTTFFKPGELVTLEALIDRADQALYASKAAGRNRLTMAGLAAAA